MVKPCQVFVLSEKKTAGEDCIHSANTPPRPILSQTSTSTAQRRHCAKPQVCWTQQSRGTLYWWTDDTSGHPGHILRMLQCKETNDRMNKEHLSVGVFCFFLPIHSSNSFPFPFRIQSQQMNEPSYLRAHSQLRGFPSASISATKFSKKCAWRGKKSREEWIHKYVFYSANVHTGGRSDADDWRANDDGEIAVGEVMEIRHICTR